MTGRPARPRYDTALRSDGHVEHDDLSGRVLVDGIAEPADPLDYGEAFGHLPQERVIRREPRVRSRDDEELTPRGPGRVGAGLRPRDPASDVFRVGRRRVDHAVAGPAGPRAGWISALDDEAGDDPVKARPVEELLPDERREGRRSARRVLNVEHEGEHAEIRAGVDGVRLRAVEQRKGDVRTARGTCACDGLLLPGTAAAGGERKQRERS